MRKMLNGEKTMVSTHASVRRRRRGEKCVLNAQTVSTHASVRRRPISQCAVADAGGFNSRLREEATVELPQRVQTVTVSTHASVRRRQ